MTAGSRPNILFIMSDDHASHAISSYTASDPNRPVINQTPNIDRLATGGMRFDNCFCTNAICTPSRAVILTGKYSHHPQNQVRTFLPMDNTLPTVAKDLQAAGYQTAMIGKWHLGTGPDHCPTGFDYWKVLPGQGDYEDPVFHELDPAVPGGRVVRERGYVTDIITDITIDYLDKRDKSRPFFVMCHHKAPHRSWIPKEEHARQFEQVDIPFPASFNDDHSASAARKNARMRIETDFDCEDVDVFPPPGCGWKTRMEPPEDVSTYRLELFNRFADEEDEPEPVSFKSNEERKAWLYQRYMRKYLATVHAIDENVGRLLDYLDNEGLTGNTLVMYTSDQGFFLGDHGWYDKRFMYEESLRMPLLARFPAEIPAGSTTEALVLNLDFAATWLDLAGVPVPSEMQGRSTRDVLRGNTPPDWRTSMYYRYWMESDLSADTTAHYGIRTAGPGRPEMKLIYYYADGMGIADNNQFGKLIDGGIEKPEHPREWECFNLGVDPYEMRNVYNDPAYADIVSKLKVELHDLQRECGDEPHPDEQD